MARTAIIASLKGRRPPAPVAAQRRCWHTVAVHAGARVSRAIGLNPLADIAEDAHGCRLITFANVGRHRFGDEGLFDIGDDMIAALFAGAFIGLGNGLFGCGWGGVA